jgi:hypothetical protein
VLSKRCYQAKRRQPLFSLDLTGCGEPRFHGELPNASEFQWRFISALYSGTPFPVLDEFTVYKNLVSLAKMSQVALETLPDVLQAR